MKLARGIVFGLLLAVGLARVGAYLTYAAACLPSPLETFHLEAKMVLLCLRAELGESLYPAWRDHPHVANFFGPAYFWAVGRLGRLVGAEIPGLFSIGRGVAFGSGLLTSAVVGLVAGRKYGRFAGVAAGTLSLGAAPMFGFSVMVRPDLTAELLGVGGFFLATRKGRASGLIGGGLLVLAILTKQTAVIFLGAAVLARWIEGDRRGGLALLVGALAVLAGVVAGVTALAEPGFATGLTGESRTPWEFASFARNLDRMTQLAPDLLFFALLGLGLWSTRATGGRDPRLAVLAGVVLLSSLVLAAKRGADLNYDLTLRVVEGLAVGAAWRAWGLSTSRARSAALAGAVLIGTVAVIPGVMFAASQAGNERARAALFSGPLGREVLALHRDLFARARDPDSKILTDSGMLDLHHGKLADFGDPWLFRVLAETGQVDLKVMRDRVDTGYYDLIVTTSELERPGYDSYEFGLPRPLVERARARYRRIGTRAGLFLYGPRPIAEGPRRPTQQPD